VSSVTHGFNRLGKKSQATLVQGFRLRLEIPIGNFSYVDVQSGDSDEDLNVQLGIAASLGVVNVGSMIIKVPLPCCQVCVVLLFY
jgi:hypothetical protein